jgi:metal-responsive CopG/Arc/MetJ family transcriptional regulator
MKTAISVPNDIFERIESYAKKKKISRSQLFSKAAEEYLDKREKEDITANLNEVYSKEDSSVDPVLFKMAMLSMPKEEW